MVPVGLCSIEVKFFARSRDLLTKSRAMLTLCCRLADEMLTKRQASIDLGQ